MQSEMSWHRPRCWLVCLVLVLCAASTGAVLKEPAANLTLNSDDIYRDCSDLPPYSPSGIYRLQPGLVAPGVPAYCDMDNDDGGWTVVLRRDDIKPHRDFYRDWDTYKYGHGVLDEEFYWGNEYLWQLTSQLDREYQVHFYLEDFDGNTRYALYQNFAVESEEAEYLLRVGEYSGNAGDSFSCHSNHTFNTFDGGSCTSCASTYHTAWWNSSGNYYFQCQLTGQYYDGGNSGHHELGIVWYDWKSSEPYSLKAAVMKIKPSKKL